MMRAMMAGISGLRMHQIKMDVIGNNIANVNTTGFKSSRVTFKEVFSSTTAEASAPDGERGVGGVNPMQVGMGIALSSIDLQYTEGSVDRTDNPLDVSIEGSGLFVTQDNAASGFYFTRAGMFGIDKSGNLITSSGARVCGWQSKTKSEGSIEDDTFDTTLQVSPINVYHDDVNGNKKIIAPQATNQVVLSGNINSANKEDEVVSIPMSLYDAYGNEHQAQIEIERRDGAVNTWNYRVSLNSAPDETIANGTLVFENEGDATAEQFIGKFKEMTTNKATDLDDLATEDLDDITNGKLSLEIAFDPDDTSNVGTIEFDFNALTQYASGDSAKVFESNGYSAGELVDYSIGADGIITGVYSNGKQQPLAMIAIASFDNPQGLKKVGDSSFTQTANSGEFKAVAPNTTAGSLVSNTLELSNVDLSKEFTEMIITQRGFQSNSRIITTSDEMLQELVNLKR